MKKYQVTDPTRVYTRANISKMRFLNSFEVCLMSTFESDKPGSLRAIKYNENFSDDILDFQCHNEPITGLKVSFDDAYIFTIGNDGCLIVYEVKNKACKNKLLIHSASKNRSKYSCNVLCR